jgi:hypothetical protein
MEFIESHIFERQVDGLLSDDEFAKDDLNAAEKKTLKKLNENW